MSSSKVKAGEAYVEIGIRNRIAQGAKGIQNDLDKIGRKVTAMGGVLGAIGLSMGAPFAFASRTLANFDDAVRATGAVSKATSSQLESMRSVAMELGRTTSFTAVEVAGLMAELGRAGFSPEQINNMTGAVLDLARATGTDAVLASGIMAATIRQFGLAATDAARVSDVLTAAANGSFNTVEQLGEALSYAGPVAADFNMSIEETAAILGTLGNVGIQASNAGTALRRLLTITGAEAERLKEIFGVTFVDARGNARPLIDTLGEVAKSTANLGTAARSAKFNEAFGLLGITGASAIGKVTTETKALYESLLTAQGQARKTAIEMDAGLGGSFRKIASAVEGSVIAIGESFGPSLQVLTDRLTEAVGSFTAWINRNKEFVAVAAASSAGLIGIGSAIVGVGVSMQVASYMMRTVSTGFIALEAVAKIASATMTGFMGVAQGVGTLLQTAFATSVVGTTAALGSMAVAQGIVTTSTVPYSIALIGASKATALLAITSGAASAGMLSLAGTSTPVVAGLLGVSGAAVTATATSAPLAGVFAALTIPAWGFVAAGTAIVGVLTATGIAAGITAAKGMEFAKGWEIARDTMADVFEVAKLAGGVLVDAIAAGNYEIATKAAWAGVKLAFLEAFDGIVEGFKFMWGQVWNATTTFLYEWARLFIKVASTVASALTNPLMAVSRMRSLAADLGSMNLGFDLGFDTDMPKAGLAKELAAMKELLRVSKERAAEEKKIAELADIKAQKAKIQAQVESGNLTESEGAAAMAAIDGTTSGSAKFEADRKRRLDELNEMVESGEITPGEWKKRVDAINAETEAYHDKVKAIEMEILALEQGEEAAERAKMTQEGLTEAQIKEIEALRAKKKALEDVKAAQDKAMENRVGGIFDRADELGEAGVAPAEIFKRVMAQIDADQASGKLTPEAAGDARDQAREDLDQRIADMKRQGKALAESLRGPFEVLQAERKRIEQLRAGKFIDDKTADAALRRAQGDFNSKVKGVDNAIEQEKALGPTGTFSAFAASTIGMGQAKDKKELIEIAKNTRESAKLARKDRLARFAR